jgi:hypothetical protein
MELFLRSQHAYCGERECIKSRPTTFKMRDNARPHPRIPEILEVPGDALRGFVSPLMAEERADLVRHAHKFVDIHVD